MFRNALVAAVGVASLGLTMSAAQAADIDVTFDLLNVYPLTPPAGKLDISNPAQYKQTVDGVSLAITPIGTSKFPNINPNTLTWDHKYGVGVKSGVLDTNPLMTDDEGLKLTFAPKVSIDKLDFELKGNGSDAVIIGTKVGDIWKFLFVAKDEVVIPDSKETVAGSFDLVLDKWALPSSLGAGLTEIKVDAVPLPAAVWGGMALMGMIGGGRLRKRLQTA